MIEEFKNLNFMIAIQILIIIKQKIKLNLEDAFANRTLQ